MTDAVASLKRSSKDISNDGGVNATRIATETGEVPKKRPKKQVRYAMLLTYLGKHYFGMQLQKDAPTIEGCLLDAMFKCGYITEEQKNRPYSFYFQRASRTDRSVSALRQVCSMMLPLNEYFPVEGPSALNDVLPHDIRVMGIRRATPGFHAQKACDSRTYSYTLPTFAFAKYDQQTTYSYRIDQKTIDEVNGILELFRGTHNFFNYTARCDSNDRSCFRYIMEFKCGDLRLFKDDFSGQEIEFLTILIKGQSFMLHQIRKMIGMTITIMRGFLYKSDIQRSFDAVRMDVPRAPGLGLLLEKLHYSNYDRKFKRTHETLDDWGGEIEAKVNKMRDELIVPEIMKQEFRTQSMLLWLSGLLNHEFVGTPDKDVAGERLITSAAHTAKVALEEKKHKEENTACNESTAEDGPCNDEEGNGSYAEEDNAFNAKMEHHNAETTSCNNQESNESCTEGDAATVIEHDSAETTSSNDHKGDDSCTEGDAVTVIEHDNAGTTSCNDQKSSESPTEGDAVKITIEHNSAGTTSCSDKTNNDEISANA